MDFQQISQTNFSSKYSLLSSIFKFLHLFSALIQSLKTIHMFQKVYTIKETFKL